jgi:hypothetical protein
VLATGPPAIRQSDADALARLVEFAFDANLSKRQGQALQGTISERAGEAGLPLSMLAEAKVLSARIDAVEGAAREIHRLSVRDSFLQLADRHADGPISELIGDLWSARSPILMPGDPPLRRTSVEAMMALFEWLASEATGQLVELTEVERDDLANIVAGQYTRAAPGDRMLLQHMEHTLYWVQVEYEQAGLEARTNFKLNLADLFGVPKPLLPAPFGGKVATWEHPDDLFALEFPDDWPARYGTLPNEIMATGWALIDIAIFGDAPSDVLELAALPDSGAIVCTAVLPEDARAGRMSLHEATFAFAAELLAHFGDAAPLGDVNASDRAVLMAWHQEVDGREYAIWVSAVTIDEPEGAAILTLTRAPVDQVDQLAPAFSRIIHSLRSGASTFDEALDLPDPHSLTRSLLNTPLSRQMDLVEALGSDVR